MKRSELKELIKACVVEVLQEGIGTSASPVSLREAAVPRPSRPTRTTNSRAKPAPIAVDTGISQDPVLQSIFQDTAATTLQEQVVSERRGPPVLGPGADRATLIAAENDPEDLFEGSSNWERLAFDI